MIIPSRTVAGLLLLACLMLCACGAGRRPYVPPPEPNGSRIALTAGHWTGTMGETYVNFNIDRVTDTRVAININGGLSSPTAHNMPGNPVTFTDRPTTCKRSRDGLSFDCLRYKDMHIDNGFLCGTYRLYGSVYHPCFAPVVGPKWSGNNA